MEKTVSLSLETLLRECSLNHNLDWDHLAHFSLVNRENIHQAFKYRKFNEDFTSRLACYNDGTYIIGTISPSYDEFLDKLLTILNIKHNGKIEDNDELTKKMQKRLEVLRNIETEGDLLLEFPLLFKDLNDGRKYYRDLQKLRKQEKISDDRYVSGEHYYYSCALKRSLKNFIDTQSVMYERYINDRKELKRLQESTSYNSYIRKNFDIDKLYMYTMHEYLRACESSQNRAEIKKYIGLIERYLASNCDKSCSITTDEGIKIDINNIKARLNNIKRVIAVDSSVVNWVLIPEGKTYKKAKQHGTRTISINQEELQQLKSLGERKTAFYESTPYVAKAIGLKRYKGYVAYIYENGEVILDREYDHIHPKQMKDNAIYNIKIEDFETLTKLDKQILVRISRVGRIYHRRNWCDKVKKIIERPATEQEKEKTKQLVKRLKEKSH